MEKFGEVYWTEQDLKDALEECGCPATENNISKLFDECQSHHFTERMIEAGWDYMYACIGSGNGWDKYESN